MKSKLLWVSVFAITFAFVESSVVVYLRSLYYPEGFQFPLKLISPEHITVELFRELATLFMLVAVGILAGNKRWEKFAYFMIAFGVWDIFYYVWLKVTLNWPASLFDWDVLFLLPVPWIGPVIAPVLISVLLIVAGVFILRRLEVVGTFRPPGRAWSLSIAATILVLLSFTFDFDATLRLLPPKPFRYDIFFLGFFLYIVAVVISFRGTTQPPQKEQ